MLVTEYTEQVATRITERGYRKLGADRKQTWKYNRCKQSGVISPQPSGDSVIMTELKASALKLAPLDLLVGEVKLRACLRTSRTEISEP